MPQMWTRRMIGMSLMWREWEIRPSKWMTTVCVVFSWIRRLKWHVRYLLIIRLPCGLVGVWRVVLGQQLQFIVDNREWKHCWHRVYFSEDCLLLWCAEIPHYHCRAQRRAKISSAKSILLLRNGYRNLRSNLLSFSSEDLHNRNRRCVSHCVGFIWLFSGYEHRKHHHLHFRERIMESGIYNVLEYICCLLWQNGLKVPTHSGSHIDYSCTREIVRFSRWIFLQAQRMCIPRM